MLGWELLTSRVVLNSSTRPTLACSNDRRMPKLVATAPVCGIPRRSKHAQHPIPLANCARLATLFDYDNKNTWCFFRLKTNNADHDRNFFHFPSQMSIQHPKGLRTQELAIIAHRNETPKQTIARGTHFARTGRCNCWWLWWRSADETEGMLP